MSLDKKLNKLDSRGEEKKINLRMPKGKVDVLEILAEHYGITVSTLIREMIDNSLVQLQKELVVVGEGYGVKVNNEFGEEEIRYLPDIISLIAPSIFVSGCSRTDFRTVEEYDKYVVENERLSVEFGLSEESFIVSPITNKEFEFKKNRNKEEK